MIHYKSKEEVDLIKESCLLVSQTLEHVAYLLQPGISTKEIDDEAESFILSRGGLPAFKGYRGFPNSLCISVNHEVVHGIPSAEVILKDGDIVSLDCGVLKNGYYGDAAYTFLLGNVSEEIRNLCRATLHSLYKGIQVARVGMRMGDIGYAIQSFIENECGYGVVRELVGHGIGKSLHEEPVVSNVGRRGTGQMIKSGLVIAIEPMVNLGKKEVAVLEDGWTVVSKDATPSAHYEHTIAIFHEGVVVLSDHTGIEKACMLNPFLVSVGERMQV
jgi:methionyl aminopeptidase